ncbi:MAG TPA: class I SAM-dependent methyltransferase [Streptosporangiaceae bacterium]
MRIVPTSTGVGRRVAAKIRGQRSPKNLETVNYEAAWDDYARVWRDRHPRLAHIGDEWTGEAAGAATSLREYEALIETRFIIPYIEASDDVLEIGVGGGRTAALLKKRCHDLSCADISAEMLRAAKERLGGEGISYVKLDGVRLRGVARDSIDVCFCFDTMVHIEPRDIFNYLTQIPALMRGKRLCIFHHTNTLSERGWERFLREWDKNLMGRRGGSFSVMTNALMERFLSHLGYEVLGKDTETIPRDCVWIARAPERLRL